MKKWKIIRMITMLILCIFVFYTIYLAIAIHNSNVNYPHEALGAIEINNWIENFGLEIMIRLYILGIPLIINIILMIVSIIKIRKYE